MQTPGNRFIRATIKLSGRVQGVGFRPFVYRLAEKYGIKGYVLNNMEGVEILAEGEENSLLNFIESLDFEKPPLAVINNKYVDFSEQVSFFYKKFEIKESDKTVNKNYTSLTIPPDIAICDKCLDELFNPYDRRYLYPFINCTDCGPRFTISKGLPYDRVSTSMDKFKMCHECQEEYINPLSRRFHAEPNGCFTCGPEIEFVLSSDISDILLRDYPEKIDVGKMNVRNIKEADNLTANKILQSRRLQTLDAVKSIVDLIKGGGIACVKGIGGFHLMADAANEGALKLLRERKSRPRKPFAVMFKDMEQVLKYAQADDISAGLLTSKERPICLLKDKGNLSYYVNCGLKDIGAFLPYAPLHYIIFSLFDGPLVATSANIGGEPIAKDNEEAFLKLNGIADGFLIHNRDILRRCDDSVIKTPFFIRRSRGYVPEPVNIAFALKRNVLAAGVFLKNTFAIAYGSTVAEDNARNTEKLDNANNRDTVDNSGNKKNADANLNNDCDKNNSARITDIGKEKNDTSGSVILSQHNGDLDNLAGLMNFKENIKDFEKFYNFKPDVVVCDAHPSYENTKWAKDYAKEKGIKCLLLQHHRAHIISCMAENGIGKDEEVFGIAFDGTGYGDDGTIWGGEFFKGTYMNLKRMGSFKKFRLIGGEKAVKSPRRILLAILFDIFTQSRNSFDADLPIGALNVISDLTGFSEKDISNFLKMWKKNINSPYTTSCGRIFDAVSCLCGFKSDITYEGEAAVYLEDLCSESLNESEIKSSNENGSTSKKEITKELFCDKNGHKFNYYQNGKIEDNEINEDDSKKSFFKYSISNERGADFFTVDYNLMFLDMIKAISDNNNHSYSGPDGLKPIRPATMNKSIAGKFINTLAAIIKDAVLRAECKNVCMSGGVFQNSLLRNKTSLILKENGFNVYFNEKIPPNDGGISFGQAVYGGIISL